MKPASRALKHAQHGTMTRPHSRLGRYTSLGDPKKFSASENPPTFLERGVERFFQFEEGGLDLGRHVAPADFHRHLGRVAVQVRDQDVTDDHVELVFFVRDTC